MLSHSRKSNPFARNKNPITLFEDQHKFESKLENKIKKEKRKRNINLIASLRGKSPKNLISFSDPQNTLQILTYIYTAKKFPPHYPPHPKKKQKKKKRKKKRNKKEKTSPPNDANWNKKCKGNNNN